MLLSITYQRDFQSKATCLHLDDLSRNLKLKLLTTKATRLTTFTCIVSIKQTK